ncbi:MAG: hypothetical protein IT577_15170 [Verrucomicrobiae bacterium]|nr:hypothetical protein [Verrucomicrobiae bacterium]
MAVKLIANYSKRLGLPGYSSHQFAVSVECEIASVADAAGESGRLYRLLQQSVDSQIVATGFVPPHGYGMNGDNGNEPNGREPAEAPWACSDKQRDLILRLVEEHNLDKGAVEALSRERFGKSVKQLSKLEASGLIDELIAQHGGNGGRGNGGNRRGRRNAYARGAA